MILSDEDILAALDTGKITIQPEDLGAIQPCSYDLRLDDEFLTPPNYSTTGPINPLNPPPGDAYQKRATSIYVLPARGFVLATTQETVTLDSTVAAQVEGKSSLGRLGLQVHSTAGFIDPGFHGQITLEISNQLDSPIELHAGMFIAQLVFTELNTPAFVGYERKGRYQSQTGPTPSKGTTR